VVEKEGTLLVRVANRIYQAEYTRADGRIMRRSTNCSSKEAALDVLRSWELDEDRIRCGRANRIEVDVGERELERVYEQEIDAHGKKRETGHLVDYLAADLPGRKGATRSARRIANVRGMLKRLGQDLRWNTLRDLDRSALQRWLNDRVAQGMAASRVRAYAIAATSFARWCMSDGRLRENPFRDLALPRLEAKRKPRTLTVEELKIPRSCIDPRPYLRESADAASHRP